jgi:hypothetical protein
VPLGSAPGNPPWPHPAEGDPREIVAAFAGLAED